MVGMRKWILIALGIAAMGLTACRHLEQMDGPVCLTAVMEGDAQTKTSLSPAEEGAYNVLWSSSDKIGVYVDNGTTPVTFSLNEGAGSTQATFSGKGVGDQYLAVYPQSAFTSRSGNTFQVNLPIEQTYKQGNLADGAYPMVAVGESTVLPFKNLCSIIRISLTGTQTVNRVVFRSNNPSVKLSGRASVDVSNPDAPVLTMASNACDSLVLNTGNVKLNQTTPTDFYLVVPAQTYEEGFSFRVYADDTYMEKEHNSAFTTVRSLLHKAGVLAFEPVVRASQYLTFTSEGTTTISLTNMDDNAPVLYYSTDKRKWKRWDYSALTVSSSAPLYLCGNNPSGFGVSDSQYSWFKTSGDPYRIEGSIMSLLDKDRSITVIPSSYCFYRLFNYSENLAAAPELPATTLTASCYREMFLGCNSIQSAPELPATTLAASCYQEMFRHCTSLNYVQCLVTNITASDCVKDWLFDVAPTGTFVKDCRMQSWPEGSSGIPAGWTVENGNIPYNDDGNEEPVDGGEIDL